MVVAEELREVEEETMLELRKYETYILLDDI